MSFKSQLKEILQKYPFIHVDQIGELSIVVPLTGSRKITDDLSTGEGTSAILFLFGDNTCKADLERRKFFYGSNGDPYHLFASIYSQLMRELTQLSNDPSLTSEEQKFIGVLKHNIDQFGQQTIKFKRHNPGHEAMKIDFEYGEEHFLVSAEFIVDKDTYPDYIRSLSLPNIITLGQPKVQNFKHLISKSLRDDCHWALSQIKEVVKEENQDLIKEAVSSITDIHDYLNQVGDKTPSALFKVIYTKLQEQNTSLVDQSDNFFDVLEENWGYLEYDESSTKEDIIDNIKLLFNVANVFKETRTDEQKNFATVYQLCMNQLKEQFSTGNEKYLTKVKTYQLFLLQTFLYLCAIQLRLKDTEKAKKFLTIFDNNDKLYNLISMLCKDENAFIKMMEEEFQLSSEEYNSIVNMTHTIAIDHLEADHYDELRLACSTKLVQNAHYIVMGGRLYWSTVPITESSEINSLEQQKIASDSHFEIFYNQRERYVKRFKAFELIKILFNQNLTADTRKAIKINLDFLSVQQKNELLIDVIKEEKYAQAKLLIEYSKNEMFIHAFSEALKKDPMNLDLIEAFIRQNSKYIKHMTGTHLLKSAQLGELNQVKFFLRYRPDLLESTDNCKQTALLWACARGKVDVVEYLMAEGANIHVRTIIPFDYEYTKGKGATAFISAKQWAEVLSSGDPEQSSKLVSLFDNYYQFMESNFQLDPEYKNKFNVSHLVSAVNSGDLRLIEIYIKYCPHLKSEYSTEYQSRALKQQIQQELLTQILPSHEKFRLLLEEFQRKKIEFKNRFLGYDREAVECMRLLNKKLARAGNKFFLNELTIQSFQEFQNECKQAMNDAQPILKQHRSLWFNLFDICRAIIGVFATLTVIPALIVQVSTKRGYADTFFAKTEKIQTDSMKKLTQFEEQFEDMNTEVSNLLKKN